MALVGMFKLFIVRVICPSMPTGSRGWTREMTSFVIKCRDAVVK